MGRCVTLHGRPVAVGRRGGPVTLSSTRWTRQAVRVGRATILGGAGTRGVGSLYVSSRRTRLARLV
jgi:hypothetical protein